MTPRVELTIDELVLDGVDRPGEAAELIADELRRQLGREAPEALGTRIEPIARVVAQHAEGAAPR